MIESKIVISEKTLFNNITRSNFDRIISIVKKKQFNN
jgi:hypothetical protein